MVRCPARFVGLVLSIVYTIILYGIYVPDWEYQISGPGSTEKSFSVSAKSHSIFFIILLQVHIQHGRSADVHATFEFVR